ncbi:MULTISPECIES: carboxynorspermidine decarboxylase [unclassified Ruminococcus]|uniref:carboxynorspermidine decarboxylase n=1 Tax=unclassified Ruminococcus TaxID=2608920 RepID=UPI00210C1C6D|nr:MULTISPECIES: carboxynorspermidine decarboxylase [unclassified Ruminococcus]MCQ4022629.1 carboxynorspermidine decarboxylase [Ruminococcus sp. zg-924]MCQ4114869.1 carboxynorspermidine decarboxylase [Ruminococcus sp. zg-921]
MKFSDLPTPCYVIDEQALIKNLEILKGVQDRTGCKILLAQKAFSAYCTYPLISKYLSGTTASGLYEAKLGYEYFGKETHVFAPAFKDDEFSQLAKICNHIVFNSFSQLEKFRPVWERNNISVGIRINPEFSTQEGHEIYDPCAYGSRLGVTKANFQPCLLKNVDGFHFHTLCEQNSYDLIKTFYAAEKSFGEYFYNAKWLNLGGGHHITRRDYDIKALEDLIIYIKQKYDVEVYLEPGEAVALNAGYLITEVMDIVQNGLDILILDISAACHMPDVLEMPYRPPLKNSGEAGEKKFTYRLSSCTCLAGDVIGDYSFDDEIKIGDRLVFEDMAIYSMVKNNTFNGMPLPSIVLMHSEDNCEIIKRFSYDDFRERLS